MATGSLRRLWEELPTRAVSGAGCRASIGSEQHRGRAKPTVNLRERRGSVQSVSTFS